MKGSFRDLEVYKESYQMALDIHKFSLKFPSIDQRDLGSQIRRASKSIPSNIAEGYGRKSSKADFRRFLVMAMGSCNEIQVQLDFARDLSYIDQETYERLIDKYIVLGKRINKLAQAWQEKSNN